MPIGTIKKEYWYCYNHRCSEDVNILEEWSFTCISWLRLCLCKPKSVQTFFNPMNANFGLWAEVRWLCGAKFHFFWSWAQKTLNVDFGPCTHTPTWLKLGGVLYFKLEPLQSFKFAKSRPCHHHPTPSPPNYQVLSEHELASFLPSHWQVLSWCTSALQWSSSSQSTCIHHSCSCNSHSLLHSVFVICILFAVAHCVGSLDCIAIFGELMAHQESSSGVTVLTCSGHCDCFCDSHEVHCSCFHKEMTTIRLNCYWDNL